MYLEIETNPTPRMPPSMEARKETQENKKKKKKLLSIKVPSFFRCPISLDVMKSPVSLCTGVTYDRSSIQRWLESGNNTCPATMQPLPSTDLIPNLTLLRLIHLWGNALPLADSKAILDDIRSSPDPLPALQTLFDIIADDSIDEFEKSSLIGPCGGATVLASKLAAPLPPSSSLQAVYAIVNIIAKILAEEAIRKTMLSALITVEATAVSSLIRILREGDSLDSRKNAATVLDAVIRHGKLTPAENSELLSELIRLLSEETFEAALSCLVALSGARRRARVPLVRLGIVSLSTRILGEETATASVAEKALKLLEVASGCADGREEICELGERCIGAVLGRMMKVGKEGTESAVFVLWSVCHLFRDRRAQEAVAAANGGLTKILLLMQSNCSPATRQMTGDMLKIFRVNSKSCLSGYDTNTTHIMPF